ncbi:MAG: TIGR03560 family F420-dependent LLM class oxidoreductase [Chloroflexi bacterium]|nr:TIGR03560 family F420-dependent LLM class oxidoreductase [Chloroflexota bacterium]
MTHRKRPIRFGLALGNERITWEEFKEACLRLEEIGYDTLWVYDHLLPPDTRLMGAPCMDGWSLLAAIAAITKKVRVGCLVSGNTFRHPAILAKMAATVDHISGGRLEFGIGAGYFEPEHTAFGIPFYSTAERIRRLDEAVQIIKMLWTSDGRVTFNGKYYQLKDAHFEPKPIQKPHPPITIGGGGEKLTLRVVAKWANRMNVATSPEVVRHKLSVLEEHCRALGRDPDEIEKSVGNRLITTEDTSVHEGFLEAMADRRGITVEEARSQYYLTGSFDEMRQKLRQFIDLGVTQFTLSLRPPYDFAGLERFVEEVADPLRRAYSPS